MVLFLDWLRAAIGFRIVTQSNRVSFQIALSILSYCREGWWEIRCKTVLDSNVGQAGLKARNFCMARLYAEPHERSPPCIALVSCSTPHLFRLVNGSASVPEGLPKLTSRHRTEARLSAAMTKKFIHGLNKIYNKNMVINIQTPYIYIWWFRNHMFYKINV